MLPQYSKQYKSDDIDGDEANEPFLNASHRASTETAPPTYPPGPSTTGQTGRSNVQYKYEPEYPRKGSNKAAVGLMGRTKQETIEIVQRGFPELAEYDQDRISFKTGDNAIIFDEAWEHFGQHPPEVLKVMVADAPGEAERRSKRDNIIGFSILGGLISVPAIILFLCVHFSSDSTVAVS